MNRYELLIFATIVAQLCFWAGWWLCATRNKPSWLNHKLAYKLQGYQVICVEASNGIKLGELIEGVDGYWAFFPEMRGGYWEGWILRELADKLDAINRPWDRALRDFFREGRPGYQPRASLEQIAAARDGKGNPPPREP